MVSITHRRGVDVGLLDVAADAGEGGLYLGVPLHQVAKCDVLDTWSQLQQSLPTFSAGTGPSLMPEKALACVCASMA